MDVLIPFWVETYGLVAACERISSLSDERKTARTWHRSLRRYMFRADAASSEKARSLGVFGCGIRSAVHRIIFMRFLQVMARNRRFWTKQINVALVFFGPRSSRNFLRRLCFAIANASNRLFKRCLNKSGFGDVKQWYVGLPGDRA